MDDEDLLRSGLGTLTASQPAAPDRVGAVRGIVRRRARRRAAVSGGLALAGVAAAAVLLQPGPVVERTLPPAGPGLTWEPRGDLVDEADAAVDVWAPAGVRDLRVLFAGRVLDPEVLLGRVEDAERWYVLQGDPGDGPRLAVLRDRDGTGPGAPVVVGEQAVPPAGSRSVSVLLTDAPATDEPLVWPGKPGADLTSTLFVLPRPQARQVVRHLVQGTTERAATGLPTEPSLTTFRTPTAVVQLAVDREQPHRAGMPGGLPPQVTVAPPDLPEGWVAASSGTGAGSVSGGPDLGVPVRVLVRCTTWGADLSVTYDQTSFASQAEVACDGASHDVFGVLEPAPSSGAPAVSTLRLEGADVDALQHVLAVREADADRLGIRPPDAP